MPRMLTLWLDYTEKPFDERRRVEMAKTINSDPAYQDAFQPRIVKGRGGKGAGNMSISPFAGKEDQDIIQVNSTLYFNFPFFS